MTVDVRGYTRAVLNTAGARLKRGDRAVLMAITLHANAHTAETWVSATQLGVEVDMTERNVRHHLAVLVEACYVIAERRPGRSTLYRLPAAPIEVIHTPVAGDRGGSEVPRSPTTGHPGRPRPDTPVAHDRRNSHGTVRETLPTVHVANGFAVTDDECEEFEVSPDIYARIGHRLGPKATPRGAVQ